MKVRTLQSSFLMIVGAVILMYKLMSFEPAFTGPHTARGKHYKTEQKIWGAVGAGLLVLGLYIDSRGRWYWP